MHDMFIFLKFQLLAIDPYVRLGGGQDDAVPIKVTNSMLIMMLLLFSSSPDI